MIILQVANMSSAANLITDSLANQNQQIDLQVVLSVFIVFCFVILLSFEVLLLSILYFVLQLRV